MPEPLRFALCAVCVAAGLIFICIGVFGVFRFRYVLNRMHASAVIDTFGTALLLLGLAFAVRSWAAVWKLGAVLAVLWIASPLSTHLVGRMELDTDEASEEYRREERK